MSIRRLYLKWNNIIQIIYPQDMYKNQIIIDLNKDNHDNKSLLTDVINELTMEKDDNDVILYKFNEML